MINNNNNDDDKNVVSKICNDEMADSINGILVPNVSPSTDVDDVDHESPLILPTVGNPRISRSRSHRTRSSRKQKCDF